MDRLLAHGIVFFSSCVLYIIVFVAGIVVQFMFKRRLTKYHGDAPAVAELATNVTQYSMSSSIALTRLVFGKQVLAMHDQTLIKYRNILRSLYICFAVIFAWLIAWMVIIAPRPH